MNPSAHRRAAWGRLLCRVAIVASVVATVVVLVVAIRAFFAGDKVSVGLVWSVGAVWATRLLYLRGLVLQGADAPQLLKAAGVVRNVVTLPLWLVVGYFLPLIEQVGWWCVKILPVTTYDLLGAFGLPHWLALAVTVVAAPFEVLLVTVLCTVLVLEPAKAIFGRDHPVVEALGDALPHVTYEGGEEETPEKPQVAI